MIEFVHCCHAQRVPGVDRPRGLGLPYKVIPLISLDHGAENPVSGHQPNGRIPAIVDRDNNGDFAVLNPAPS